MNFNDLENHIPDGVVNDVEGDADKLNAYIASAIARFQELSGVTYKDELKEHRELLIPIVNYILCSRYAVTEDLQKRIYYQFDLIKPALISLKFKGSSFTNIEERANDI